MAMPQQNAAQPGTATRAVGFAVAHHDSE